jgi:hypothetical protein
MELIGLKYCGGGNPEMDRSALVREIERLLPPDCGLTTHQESDRWDIAVMVCGCPKAFTERPTAREMALYWIHAGGATVDRESLPNDRMAGVIAGKIKRFMLYKEMLS